MSKLPLKPAVQDSYSEAEIRGSVTGGLFGAGRPQLPVREMLMINRIVKISRDGGQHGRGQIVAEMDIDPELWFFKVHFPGDAVMPGCLGLDAMWQMVGFYLGWLGHPGRGRALGVGEVKFTGQVMPAARLIQYRIDLSRIVARGLVVGIADGTLLCDGEAIYSARNLKVGLF
ncbi:MAG: bifunctional 3-hydroxydecanoyl-ACP dehydratase/trans-2-decenoyl-ACP isomerase [Cellvibrionales bacterium]|nr:bifunctional 3-hydroxydecanoyl-ACP dehydratase/trans-2-decenoyl-ACP isomerase [Cellvibrionales bacterium]